MVKKIIYVLFVILLSCSSQNNRVKIVKNEIKYTADILYKNAVSNFDKGELQKSIDILKMIEKDYPYSNLAPMSLLMISYIYYETNDYLESLKTLKKFKELYPVNKKISYAEYLTAMCLFEQINVVSKEQSTSLLALKQFNKIINQYPKSLYAEESKIKIDLIYEQLAGHEMYIARYYMNKERWAAAVLKLQNVIEKYPNTIFIDEALHRIVEINYRIGNLKMAKRYAAILGYNYNNSSWYKKTYKIVGDKNYSIINREKKKKNLKEKFLNIFNLTKDD